MSSCFFLILLLGADPAPERVTYLRPAGDRFAVECTFEIQKQNTGWSIVSSTDRGKVKMRVSARYDVENRLLAAEAMLAEGDQKSAATLAVEKGKAKVQRPGLAAQEFEVPPGVIITSAPDWTDTFLLARHYDLTKGGKQEFSGLWIHPTQLAQLVRFRIEKVGSEAIEHQGKKIELNRCLIHLRGNSAYAAWIDSKGRLVRLIPLPAKGTAGGMVLEGYEKSAIGLKAQ